MKYEQDIQHFQDHGIRPTKRRLAVFRALASVRSHPTAEELRSIVMDGGCTLSLATIYSTLDLFSRNGMVRRMSVQGHADRFDATVSSHIHLRLEDTGEVLDVPGDVSLRILDSVDPSILREIENEMGIKVDEVELQLVGRRRAEVPGPPGNH